MANTPSPKTQHDTDLNNKRHYEALRKAEEFFKAKGIKSIFEEKKQ